MTAHKNKFRPFSRKNHKKDQRVINMDYNGESLVLPYARYSCYLFRFVSVNSWAVHEVGQWLDVIQLSEYKEVFSAHEIRGEELLKLESSDLKVSYLEGCLNLNGLPEKLVPDVQDKYHERLKCCRIIPCTLCQHVVDNINSLGTASIIIEVWTLGGNMLLVVSFEVYGQLNIINR